MSCSSKLTRHAAWPRREITSFWGPGLSELLLDLARPRPSDTAVEIYAGAGLLAPSLARRVERLHVIERNPPGCVRPGDGNWFSAQANAEVRVGSPTRLPLADASADLIVSTYCFHRLPDSEKRRALREMRRVLHPGGRLVFADMMFPPRLTDRRDRHVAPRTERSGQGAAAARALVQRIRSLSWLGQQRVRAAWWRRTLAQTDFTDIRIRLLKPEGGIASARRP